MSSTTRVEVHQVLHGYSDGHTLLAASTELPRASRAAMQRLSDRSGSGDEPGFDDYLTAYPLPEVRAYAFARTWAAPEMPRPGCVWTHTLLIPYTQLAAVPTLSNLLSLFRHPGSSVGSLREEYERRIEVDTSKTAPPSVENPLEEIIVLLQTLYTTGRPVYVATESSSVIEALFLAVWAQQWPRLRRNFSFCTGSLAPRIMGGVAMDLQAVPAGRAARIQRGEPEAVFVGSADTPQDWSRWAVTAAAAMTGDTPWEDLHRFLRTFGADAGADRCRFPGLIQALLALGRSDSSAAERLREVGAVFPGRDEAIRLKRALLGTPRPFLREMPAIEALFAAYSLDNPEPYAGPEVADAVRLRLLWEDERSAQSAILLRWWRDPLNLLGSHAVQELLQSLQIESLAAALPDDPGSLKAVAAVRPDILATEPFWNLSLVTVRAGIFAAAKTSDSAARWRDAIRAGLRSNLAAVWLEFLDPLGDLAVEVILDAAAGSPAEPIRPVAEEILRSRPSAVWAWMARVDAHLEAVAPLLVRHEEIARAALDAPNAARAVACRVASESRDSAAADVVAAALLGVALTHRSSASRDLIEASFARVHDSLEAQRLPGDAETILRRVLFPGQNGVSADALRQRLVQRYEAEKWGWTALLRSVAGGSVVDQLVRLFAPPPLKQPKRKR